MIRMQYLVSVIDDTPNSATSDEMADIHAFNAGLQADGHWVFAGGLGAPSTAAVIDGRGAEVMFSDGPFVETKEWLSAGNAVHTSARDVRGTDWSQVVALYDQLSRLDPSPIVALNRAAAIAELDGPDVALGIIDSLQDELAGYHAYFVARADILRRLGRSEESRAAYDRAIALAGNTAETAYLARRRDQLG
jgi:RNA polymerase sigma-70 factor, ECF subfamily